MSAPHSTSIGSTISPRIVMQPCAKPKIDVRSPSADPDLRLAARAS